MLQNRNDLHIVIIKDTYGNIGPAASFMRLLALIEADVYLFCDQDDYWLDFKIDRAVSAINSLSVFGYGPTVYHTDLLLVDENLCLLGSSFP